MPRRNRPIADRAVPQPAQLSSRCRGPQDHPARLLRAQLQRCLHRIVPGCESSYRPAAPEASRGSDRRAAVGATFRVQRGPAPGTPDSAYTNCRGCSGGIVSSSKASELNEFQGKLRAMFETHRGEIERAVLARVRSNKLDLPMTPAAQEGMRALATDSTAELIESFSVDFDWTPTLPHSTAAYVKYLAREDVPLEMVMRLCTLIGGVFLESILAKLGDDEAKLALKYIAAWGSRNLDRLLNAYTAEYNEELERLDGSPAGSLGDESEAPERRHRRRGCHRLPDGCMPHRFDRRRQKWRSDLPTHGREHRLRPSRRTRCETLSGSGRGAPARVLRAGAVGYCQRTRSGDLGGRATRGRRRLALDPSRSASGSAGCAPAEALHPLFKCHAAGERTLRRGSREVI